MEFSCDNDKVTKIATVDVQRALERRETHSSFDRCVFCDAAFVARSLDA